MELHARTMRGYDGIANMRRVGPLAKFPFGHSNVKRRLYSKLRVLQIIT